MVYYVATDEDGRIGATTSEKEYASDDMEEFTFPDDFDFAAQNEYRIVDGELVHDPLPKPEPEPAPWEEAVTTANEAKAAAEEAKAIARSAGTDPQIQALARMQVMTMDLTGCTSTQAAGFRDYWPEWQPGTKYEYQQPLRHKGLYYRASKALTSSSIYPPDTAGESEYYPVEVAEDGVIVYRACHGQYDMVQAGETRHYPDAEGPVYRAKVDTAYDPDTVPGNWELA